MNDSNEGEISAQPGMPGRINAGVDIGRWKDLTAIVLAEQDRNKFVWVRELKTLERTPFHEQKEVLKGIINRWRIYRMAIDSTGIGENIAEDMQRAFPGKIQRVHFTREKKESMALGIKKLFEDRKIRIPNDRDLIAHLHAIKRKPTQTGFTYDTDRNEQVKHADLFWALALATKDFSERRRILGTGNASFVGV